MKRRFLIPLTILIVLIVIFLAGILWFRENTKPVSSEEKKVAFIIPRGRSASQVGESLYEKGLIRSPLAFKFYVQLTGSSDKIQAGEFLLSPNLSLVEIVERFSQGPLELWVTIPEGLRREEVVERFVKGLEMDGEYATSFRSQFFTQSDGLEGKLFPDTYLFPRDASPSAVIAKMDANFENKIASISNKEILDEGYSVNQVVVMASILERETKTADERPVVAGILWKRLASTGWLLQADATLQYAIGTTNCKSPSTMLRTIDTSCNWWPILTKENLEINSPYNSYKFKALPPTPIANPGLSSLKAAFSPVDSSYWFYIHDAEGIIHYAETLSEHNENVRIYLGK